MKINKLKINGYGKIKNKEINLEKNINLIYGKNESGKSTILNFITDSFYGISKNKKGKEHSNYDKYLPWTGEEFSGKVEYELDNKEKYEIFRDFRKKNPQIFNEKKEDISKNFNIDKNKGNEFFYEQITVDEDLFLSTVVVNQETVKLKKQEQNVLIQKVANLVGTGDDNVSFRIAIDRINRRQLDEIGTERSREKPINLINRKIEELELQKEELEKYVDIKYGIEENKNNLMNEISALENENNFLNEIKIISENEKIEKEKIKLKENLEKENEEKINELENKINDIKNNNKNVLENNFEEIENNEKINSKKIEKNNNLHLQKNKLNKKIIIFFIILILINILQFIFIKNNIFKYLFLLTVPTYLIFSIYLKNKINKKIKKEEKIQKNNSEKLEKIKLDVNLLKNQKEILEKNNNKLKEEINNLKNNFNLKINLEKEKIKNKYSEKIEKNKINNFLNSENIFFEIQEVQKNLNNKKIELHTLNIDKENIENKVENLSKIEEKLVNNKEQKVNLINLNKSMNLAKEILTQCYEEMKNTITPKFTRNLSENISEITNCKYTKMQFNDIDGLVVELENGNYIPASRLSIGTMDQLYLSLRLSMVEELSEEKMPIILDEVFAYFDEERLENILNYINKKFKNNQVIIFSCTNREKEIFDKFNIEYNYIEIE